MIAVTDSIGRGICDYAVTADDDGNGNYRIPGDIHKGGANVLFCDGHVEWFLQKDLLLSPDRAKNDTHPKRMMWNRDNEP